MIYFMMEISKYTYCSNEIKIELIHIRPLKF